MRKLLSAPLIVLGVIGLSGSAAFAHECYNASRSAKGNEGASHSKAWFSVSLDMLFEDAVANWEEYGLPEADPEDVEAMVANASARGVPSQFLVLDRATAAGGVWGGSGHSSDGKGIDHFFATYEGDLIAAYGCGAGLGGCQS